MQTQLNFGATMPVQNPTESFWQSAPDPLISNYQSADLPARADVVIIGSGLTGAFIAHRLLSSASPNKPKTVVILEARRAASGATGRNGKSSHPRCPRYERRHSDREKTRTLTSTNQCPGGHIKLDCYRGFASYSLVHGQQVAKAQCAFEAANYRETVAFIHENNLGNQVDLVEYRAADVFMSEKSWQSGLASYRGFQEAGGDVSEISLLDRAEAEGQLRVRSCYGAITFPAASLWPYKLAVAVLRKSIDLGLQLQTNTPVTGISADGDSGAWKVSTGRGDVIASKAVHATNEYSPHLLPELQGRIIPLKGHVAAIVPPPAYQEQPLSTSFAFVDDEDYDYLIQRPGPQKYLIWGGGEIAHPDGLTGGFGDCDDATNVAEVQAYIKKAPAKHFKGWE
ncbi:hypothetical protein PG997_003396 [Apiospora hydei]|uniref:FAD dependent oxidoreductase domain-containing protein n=1 Tax=Apiospora hydei TaxID=1337664 RepID=A0ABR1WZ69_9PEZI